MADSKITALTSISTSTDPANDPLVIVDVSDTSMAASGTTKKVTLNNLLACSPTATLASATITGDLTVDTSTLKVDSANNRVGVNTATPRAGFALDVLGNVALGNSTTTTSNRLKLDCSGTAGNVAIMSFAAAGTNKAFYGLSGGFLGDTSTDAIVATDAAGAAIRFYVSDTGSEAMRLNSTGLGVGGSPTRKLSIVGSGNTYANINSGDNTSLVGVLFGGTSAPSNGQIIYNNTDNSMGLHTAGAVKLTIDSSGNVGIGVTPSAWGGLGTGPGVLQMGNAGCSVLAGGAGFSGTNQFFINNNAYYNAVGGGSFKYYRAGGGAAQYSQVGNEHQWKVSSNTPVADTAITFTQAMTLTAAGDFLTGGKTAASVTAIGFQTLANGESSTAMASSTGSASVWNAYSTGAGQYRFYVAMNGTISATNTTISAISDARLKENVQDIDVGLGAILALKPRKFDWKEGKGKNIKGDRGFIAQEFEQVFPNLIDEWKDPAPEGEAPYKSVRQDLIPVLVKAIQELAARVQTLETR